MVSMSSDRTEQAADNSEPLVAAGQTVAHVAVAAAASNTGRTPDEQWKRMGDRFIYANVEMNPHQKQLDDYAISGDRQKVRR